MSKPVIVFDNGTGYLKAGLSNIEVPTVTLPALVGRPMLRYAEKIEKVELKPLMIGDEVTPVRPLLELNYPMKEGIIVNDEDMALLWDYTLNKKLNIPKGDLRSRKMLMTEAPLNPTKNKQKMGEILFEKIGIGFFNIEPQAKMTLYCEGAQTGVVLDSGDGVTHVIPIAENYLLHHQIKRLDIAGRNITNYFIRLLQIKGYSFNSTADFELARELKEKYCFVSNDIEADRKLERETSFYNSYHLLPDESRIRISDEKFEAPEILFNPALIGKEYDGIPIMMMRSINNCPIDCRTGLYGNIILSGANTLFPGFASRIENEIKKLYKKSALKLAKDKKIKININVVDSPKRKYSVFIGASIIANHYNDIENEDYWITRDEWLECEDKGSYTKENLIKNKCQSYLKDKE